MMLIPSFPISVIAKQIGIGYSKGIVTMTAYLDIQYDDPDIQKFIEILNYSFNTEVTNVNKEVLDNIIKLTCIIEEER